jgi:hypothetical protein
VNVRVSVLRLRASARVNACVRRKVWH